MEDSGDVVAGRYKWSLGWILQGYYRRQPCASRALGDQPSVPSGNPHLPSMAAS